MAAPTLAMLPHDRRLPALGNSFISADDNSVSDASAQRRCRSYAGYRSYTMEYLFNRFQGEMHMKKMKGSARGCFVPSFPELGESYAWPSTDSEDEVTAGGAPVKDSEHMVETQGAGGTLGLEARLNKARGPNFEEQWIEETHPSEDAASEEDALLCTRQPLAIGAAPAKYLGPHGHNINLSSPAPMLEDRRSRRFVPEIRLANLIPGPSDPVGEVRPQLPFSLKDVGPSGHGGSKSGPPSHVNSEFSGVQTVMIRNLPTSLRICNILEELNQDGFKDQYNYLYLPRCFKSGLNQGFAFVNLCTPLAALALYNSWHKSLRFENFEVEGPRKRLSVSAAEIQGLEANLAQWEGLRLNRIRNQDLRPWVLGGFPTRPETPRRGRGQAHKEEIGSAAARQLLPAMVPGESASGVPCTNIFPEASREVAAAPRTTPAGAPPEQQKHRRNHPCHSSSRKNTSTGGSAMWPVSLYEPLSAEFARGSFG